MADERDLRPAGDGEDAAAERFERYLEAVLSDGRPSPDDVTEGDEAEMARLAAELHAATDPDTGTPDGAFVEQLRLRMRHADAGIAAVREPLPYRPGIADPGPAGRIRLTRRQLLGGGLVAERASPPVPSAPASCVRSRRVQLVHRRQRARRRQRLLGAGRGPDGRAAGQRGALLDRGLRRLCRQRRRRDPRPLRDLHPHGLRAALPSGVAGLRCACHAASFDLTGALANGRDRWRATGGYRGDAHAYPVALPRSARPRVKVQDGQVLVWTVQV